MKPSPENSLSDPNNTPTESQEAEQGKGQWQGRQLSETSSEIAAEFGTFSKEEEQANLQPKGADGQIRHTPNTFKMGRLYGKQAHSIEHNLFTAILDPSQLNGTGASITALPKTISEDSLTAYIQAAQQILYNQSYTARNEDINSGYMRQEATAVKDGYVGMILVGLKELCQKAHGLEAPGGNLYDQMRELITAVDRYEVGITLPNGDKCKLKLIAKMGEFIRKDDGAVMFQLALNPIFCGKELLKNFGEFPQDVNKRLRIAAKTIAQKRGKREIRLTSQLRLLMQHLGMQDKRKPYTWPIDNLLTFVGLSAQYKAKKARTLEMLGNYFEILKEIRLLRADIPTNPIEGQMGDGTLAYTFHFNPDFKNPDTPQLLLK